MKRCWILFMVVLSVISGNLFAQHHSYKWIKDRKADKPIWEETHEPPKVFIFKVNALGGYILPFAKNTELIAKRPVIGGEFCVEFPSWHSYPWQKYWGDPTLGVGFVGMDLGNERVLGGAFAVYPYLSLRIADTEHFKFNIKLGTGLSFFTKTYNDTDTNPNHFNSENTNTLIGSVVNCYLTGGLNFSFPITNDFSLNFDGGFSHMSNGSILQPNAGINMFYGSIGGSYRYNTLKKGEMIRKNSFTNLPYFFSLNITASAGSRELFYLDNKIYAVWSFHFGGTYNLTNFYALGLGLDVFYDGAFVRQGTVPGMSKDEISEQTKHTRFGRYLIRDDKFSNKIRAGISINNEFLIGRVTVLLDWGIYLFDPLRNAYVTEHPKYGSERPMFYSYNIDNEDGWNWFRLGVRCRIVDNLHLQIAVKAHLNKAEMIEWGIGYHIPFKKREHINNTLFKRSVGYSVYHFK